MTRAKWLLKNFTKVYLVNRMAMILMHFACITSTFTTIIFIVIFVCFGLLSYEELKDEYNVSLIIR